MVWKLSVVFFEKTIVPMLGKFWDDRNLAICGQNLAIFGQNWQFWRLTFNFQTLLWIFLIFCMEVVLMVFFEEIILYMPGKFWYGEILAKVDSFLTFNFQTPLWIFVIFGLEVVLMVFFEKIIFCMPGKFKDIQNLAIFDQISALLWVFSFYLSKFFADLSSCL